MATGGGLNIDDDYEHDDPELEYILENSLCTELDSEDSAEARQLQELFNSKLTIACKCKEMCTFHSQLKKDCTCKQLCNDWSRCEPHGGNYVMNPFAEPPELVLASCRREQMFFECHTDCTCDERCQNRLVQLGPRKNLKIIDSKVFKSKGLITTANIPTGAFICEYAGELLTRKIARKRTEDNETTGKMNYILCLNEIKEGGTKKDCVKTIIDPSQKGNIGRYLNHSCDPNCEIYSVRVNCPVPKICIFSKRSISAGEELCFHYGGEQVITGIPIQPTGRVPCLCKSYNCEKFLPNDAF